MTHDACSPTSNSSQAAQGTAASVAPTSGSKTEEEPTATAAQPTLVLDACVGP